MRLESFGSPRIQGALLTIVLCIPLSFLVQEWWLNYWILKDGQTGTALVTGYSWGGHGHVDYLYAVDQKEYTGRGRRDWRDARYSGVGPGQHCPVYFSASHPWLSALYRPDTVPVALPVGLLILLLQSCAVATLINPMNRWALPLGRRSSGNWRGPRC